MPSCDIRVEVRGAAYAPLSSSAEESSVAAAQLPPMPHAAALTDVGVLVLFFCEKPSTEVHC